jgi:L-gulono-1,4-lactone dehydrogenase
MRREFDPDVLHEIVQETLLWRDHTLPRPALDETYAHLLRGVEARYPGRIQWPSKWLFDRSAGFLQALAILYVSTSEYMLITGTPVPMNGGSGPFRGELFDWVIDGEIVSYWPGQFDRHPTRPGECDHLPRGMMKGAAITDHYWAFEYGRGSIISMWPSTLFGALFTDCDLRNLGEMIGVAVADECRNFLRPTPPPPAWSNWMGNQSCDPLSITQARDVSDLREVVQDARRERQRVRAFGARHSWSPIVPTSGYLVDMTGLDQCLAVDPEAGTIQVQAGMRLEDMTNAAFAAGLAVPSPTVATNFTAGGMVATGSHGTGMQTETFSDAVIAMTIVNADGEVVELTADDPDMVAGRVALGTLGLVHDLTFQCTPSQNVRAIDQKAPLEEVIENLPVLVRDHHAVMLMWYPYTETAWLKLWDPTDAPVTYGLLERLMTRWTQYLLEGVLGVAGERMVMRLAPSLTPMLMKTVIALTPQRDRVESAADAYHFQFVYPKCWDSSWAVPLEDASAAWQALQAIVNDFRARGQFPVNLVVASRFVKASTSLLSPDYGRDSCYIEATTLDGTEDVEAFYRAVEDVMMSRFDARPHWGKVFYDTDRVRERYRPQLELFEPIRRRWDPDGLFLNDFLTDLFAAARSDEKSSEPASPA